MSSFLKMKKNYIVPSFHWTKRAWLTIAGIFSHATPWNIIGLDHGLHPPTVLRWIMQSTGYCARLWVSWAGLAANHRAAPSIQELLAVHLHMLKVSTVYTPICVQPKIVVARDQCLVWTVCLWCQWCSTVLLWPWKMTCFVYVSPDLEKMLCFSSTAWLSHVNSSGELPECDPYCHTLPVSYHHSHHIIQWPQQPCPTI